MLFDIKEVEDYLFEHGDRIFKNIFMREQVITSKNRKYVSKRIDLLVGEGWKLKSQSVDKDGFIRSVMVKGV
jgi:hypothetical protein